MRYALLIIGLILAGNLPAQSPALEASVSKNTVGEYEIFTYKISSNTDCVVTPPDFGEFEIVDGPVSGSQYTNINGVQSQEYSLTYYLRATKKGNYAIGPATMKCKLKKISSQKTITIKVVDNPDAAANTSQEKSGHFLKLTASKSSVYVGEPFVISFKFYSSEQPNSISAIQPGTASGLWRGDLDPNRASYVMTQEVIKGERYYVLEMLREVCIPLRPGKITIDPYYGALIYQDDFFSPATTLDGKTNSLQIDVKKIPVTVPENFNGLVGHFDLVHEVDKTTLVEGQAMELNLRISGTGNLNAFDTPKLNLPDAFTQIDAVPTENTTVTEEGLTGSLEYKYIIQAMKPGDYELQPFSFSYFDPGSKTIRQLSTEKFTVHVEKGDENYGNVINTKNTVEIVDTDIHFIHQQKGTIFRIDAFFFGTTGYLLGLAGPLLLAIGAAIIRHRRSSLSEESKAESKQKSARRNSFKSLDKATQALKQGDQKEALKQLQNAMFSFFMTRLNLSLSGLSQKAITTELEARKVDTDLVLEFSHIWRQVELAQYAPVTPENLQDNISGTRKLINNIDEKL